VRIVSYRQSGTPSYGFLVGDDGIVDRGAVPGLTAPSVRELIASGSLPDASVVEAIAPTTTLAHVELLPPVEAGKILCAGVNFPTHREETGQAPEKPKYPVIFARWMDSLVAHGDEIRRPAETESFDYEGELAVVIGKRAFQVSEADALDHVFGWSVFDDGSVRDWQRHSPQWIPGKNFWRSGSFGPAIVTADAMTDIGESRLQTRVNGEVRQDALIKEMVFSVAELIAYCSTFTPLEPGDVIAAGTPGGVGLFFDPPRLLSDGDVVDIEIDGVGLLSNTVRQA
jgi:2-keto-4-pentenoate hydratase/2-oxohepta-3-ene-1,7-dioic acid hydratase in catechol pathway